VGAIGGFGDLGRCLESAPPLGIGMTALRRSLFHG
jgi:hypothetical protein